MQRLRRRRLEAVALGTFPPCRHPPLKNNHNKGAHGGTTLVFTPNYSRCRQGLYTNQDILVIAEAALDGCIPTSPCAPAGLHLVLMALQALKSHNKNVPFASRGDEQMIIAMQKMQRSNAIPPNKAKVLVQEVLSRGTSSDANPRLYFPRV